MRHLIVALILLLLCSPCFSKMRHLERKEESKRNEYLVDKAKDWLKKGIKENDIIPYIATEK